MLVILSGWIPMFLNLRTFMFTWKVELAASVFIAAVSAYLLLSRASENVRRNLSQFDLYFVILPLMLFIAWSAASALWAASPQSAWMHTAMWMSYLVFYLTIRYVLENQNNFKLILALLTILLIIVGMPVIAEYAFLLYAPQTLTTLGIRSGKYNELINIVCPLLMTGILRWSGSKFRLGVFCVAVLWLFAISTMSRTGFGLFIVGMTAMTMTVFWFDQFKKYRRKTLWLLMVLALAPVPVHLISLLCPKPEIPMISKASNETAMKASNNSRKMLASVSLEIANAHRLIGIGANNFGVQQNNFRRAYGAKTPTDINLATSEDEIPERTHNEYLQILSELGLIGVAIFLSFLAGVVYLTLRLWKNRKRTSLFSFAALGGVWLFLISSTVSSYSFRLVQNGLVFFFALALASKLIVRHKQRHSVKNVSLVFNKYSLKIVYAFGIFLTLFLGTNSIFRAVSTSYSNELLDLRDAQRASFLYDQAIFYNRENPHAYLGYGLFLLNQGHYQEAGAEIYKAIRYGETSSATYSLLATAQTLGGDQSGAVETFAEAVDIYPHSTFVRTRYADLLQLNGDEHEAQNQLAAAHRINHRTAKTWWNLYREGVAKTNLKTVNDPDLIIVFDLKPQLSYTAYMQERWIRYPEEKPKLPLMAENK